MFKEPLVFPTATHDPEQARNLMEPVKENTGGGRGKALDMVMCSKNYPLSQIITDTTCKVAKWLQDQRISPQSYASLYYGLLIVQSRRS